MAKFNSKLSNKEIDLMLYNLCLAVAEIRNPNEAAEFFRDLLSYQESEMIAKRLKIAELLDGNEKYEDIIRKLKVSSGTIARVQEWMKISGEGYKKAISRTRGKVNFKLEELPAKNWNSIKKSFPMYYWPEIVLENIIASSNKKQKEKLQVVIKALEKSKEKTDLYRKLKKLIKY